MQTPSVLRDYLAAGLLPIGEDDQKLDLLEKASSALASQLEANPALTHRFTLVALDATAPDADPVHKLANDALVAEWATVSNRVGANPVQIHRALLLRAIELASIKQTAITAVPGLVASGIGEKPSTTERKALDAFLARMAASAEHGLATDWTEPGPDVTAKQHSKTRKPSTIRDELASNLMKAFGPTDREGKPIAQANAQVPTAGQAWTLEAVPRTADAIATAISGGTKAVIDESNDLLRELAGKLGELNRIYAIRDAKAELVWLHLSGYSPSAKATYSSLNESMLAMHAALDVSRSVRAHAPPSVDHFLRDLVSRSSTSTVAVRTFLKTIGPQLALHPEGRLARFETLPNVGLRGWIDIAVRGGEGAPDSKARVAELAVRLFQEMQVGKLVADGLQ